jgi:hypothetical protein
LETRKRPSAAAPALATRIIVAVNNNSKAKVEALLLPEQHQQRRLLLRVSEIEGRRPEEDSRQKQPRPWKATRCSTASDPPPHIAALRDCRRRRSGREGRPANLPRSSSDKEEEEQRVNFLR